MRVGGKRRILVRPERGWFKGQARAGELGAANV